MSAVAEEIKASALRLSIKERADLAYCLIESLDTEVDEHAEEAWDAELARRAEAIRQGTAVGKPAEAVFPELRGASP
jgi:putative addiction module component (TIGR02574 family)